MQQTNTQSKQPAQLQTGWRKKQREESEKSENRSAFKGDFLDNSEDHTGCERAGMKAKIVQVAVVERELKDVCVEETHGPSAE